MARIRYRSRDCGFIKRQDRYFTSLREWFDNEREPEVEAALVVLAVRCVVRFQLDVA